MARSTKAESARPAGLPLVRLLAVSVVALTTANCAQNTQKLASAPAGSSSYDPKYGVKASPRLYNEGDTIPKGGGRRFSGKPYVVAGRTYVPHDNANGYVREGLASWYGSAFHGRMTANGEVFDRHSIAAAHPTLPLPSYVRVTNLANRHSMIVRVNDRGPYHANRLMDVSEEVAEALQFHRSGTAKVRVEYVGKASTAGSDDRKLMATLRTDGAPASVGGRSIMMADLGSDAAPERLERETRPAFAFKPAEDAPAPPRPVRAAPVLVAGGSHIAVPPALQPTAARSRGFQPTLPARSAASMQMAHAAPKGGKAPVPASLPATRLASAAPAPAALPQRQAKAAPVSVQAGARPGAIAAAAPRAPAAPMVGRAGLVVKTASVAPPARPVAAPVASANSRPSAGPLGAAKASLAKLSVPPTGSQPAAGQIGRAKAAAPAVASAAKPASARRSHVAGVN